MEQIGQPRRVADYALVLDVLGQFAGATSESAVRETIFEVFTLLFAPRAMAYLSVVEGKPGALFTRAGGAHARPDAQGMTARLFGLLRQRSWSSSDEGFVIAVAHGDAVLTIIEVEGLALPAHRDHYLGLARSMLPVLQLAILNARAFEELQRELAERRRVEAVLKEREADLRHYAIATVTAQEAERRKIALELHEGVLQLLATAAHRLGSHAGAGSHAQVSDMIARATEEVRRISQELRPSILDDLGLPSAIQSLCSAFEARTGTHVHLGLAGLHGRLGDKVELTLFRIAQDALNTIESHSAPGRVEVNLTAGVSAAHLRICEDGDGLAGPGHDAAKGLFHLQERAVAVGGTVAVGSTPEGDTVLSVSIPVEASSAAE